MDVRLRVVLSCLCALVAGVIREKRMKVVRIVQYKFLMMARRTFMLQAEYQHPATYSLEGPTPAGMVLCAHLVQPCGEYTGELDLSRREIDGDVQL